MITSKEIIKKTGISRATLNNYIKLGIIPRPVVAPPPPGEKGAKQIGYFPEDVFGHIEKVKKLKEQGKSMEEISRLFQEESSSGYREAVKEKEQEERGESEERRQARPYTRRNDDSLKVTICDITTPAYLVNLDYEIEWINKQAEDFIFHKKVRSMVDGGSRNIFRLFLEQHKTRSEEITDLLGLHLTVLQKELNETDLSRLYAGISERGMQLLKNLLTSGLQCEPQQVYHLPAVISPPGHGPKNYILHTMKFREGTFFVYLPDEGANPDILSMLGQRERVINDLLRHKMPTLMPLSVLVAGLQDSMRISAELLPAQYFELINGLWEATGPVFSKYKGVYGKHIGDGVLYYFLGRPGEDYIKNCINCAVEVREVMSFFSDKWKGVKGWDRDLYLNTGINEGQEFFGTIRSANNIEFTALGDTINVAVRLSEFAADGQIWATKNLISRLPQEERNMLRFGVHHNNNPANRFIRDSFARVTDLVAGENNRYRDCCTIAGLPITEIKERVNPVLV